jgi:choline-sulfatase
MNTSRPNILLILTDQHSPHIAGFAGHQHINTQALDRLAGQSMVFEAAYCQSPLCVPSRMSLWSGKYPHRISAWANQSVLAPEHMTIPRWLAQHGYVTAAVGKMHFRGQDQMLGFQHRPYGDLIESSVPCHQPDPPETADGRSNNHAVGRFPFAGPSSIPEGLHADTLVTVESLAWLLEFSDTHPEQPWFFCASYFRPHFPLTAPGRYVRKYLERDLPRPLLPDGYPDALHPHDRFIVEDFRLTRFSDEEHRRALASYYAALDYVDDRIGELIAGLEQAGCLENTIIVYTSDHGDMVGEHGLWWKRTYYEASAGVPLLISGPNIEHRRIDAPVELVDLFPTFCDWAGIETPLGLDGESLLPFLTGQPDQRRKRTARSELLGGKAETRFRMVRDARWKYVDFPAAPPRLFDLMNDPDETTDLSTIAPADAPLAELAAQVERGGTWDTLAERFRVDQASLEPIDVRGKSAVQFRLTDGRVIDADDHLYDGLSLAD